MRYLVDCFDDILEVTENEKDLEVTRYQYVRTYRTMTLKLSGLSQVKKTARCTKNSARGLCLGSIDLQERQIDVPPMVQFSGGFPKICLRLMEDSAMFNLPASPPRDVVTSRRRYRYRFEVMGWKQCIKRLYSIELYSFETSEESQV